MSILLSVRKNTGAPGTFRAAVLYGALLLCMIEAFNNTAIAVIVGALAALMATRDLGTWIMFMAASQIVPDPLQSPLTLAQLGVCAWIIRRGPALTRQSFRLPSRFLRLCTPFSAWMAVAAVINRTIPEYNIWFGVAVGIGRAHV